MKNNFIYIQHILDSINNIEDYTSNMSHEEFYKDNKTIDAVIRNIEIVGEATSKCNQEFKEKYPQIPWRKMADTRNKLIHDYMGVSVKIVWEICKTDLPNLKPKLQALLDSQRN